MNSMMKEASRASARSSDSNKPKYSKFTQQELRACKPLLTTAFVLLTLALIGIIFISIGLVCLFASEHVVEIVDRYDSDCIPSEDKVGFIQSDETNKTCIRTLVVPKHMKSPINVYYQLDNFFQNNRRYVKSRSDVQLLGQETEHENTTKKCAPESTTPGGDPIVPCGLIAWSLFNDTYKFSVNSKSLEVNKKYISCASDREHKFGKNVYPKNFQTGSLIGGATLNASIPLSEQEDLMVWMRTAALSTFRKLYGRIEVDLVPNEIITVEIQNQYNTYSFEGKKTLVLSTMSWLGGKNDFLGVAYLSVGVVCIFLAMSFLLLHVFNPRTLGDLAYLSWNTDNADHFN